jgi:hypothetical protein
MKVLVWTMALALAAPAARAAKPDDASGLAALATEVRAADYRGDRAALQRLAGALDAVKLPSLAAYRAYWQGFALWRRALNGFNEPAWPGDLEGDLQAAVARFREALLARPDWIEAKIGMVGASASLVFLAGEDAAKRQKILAEFVPLAREIAVKGADNPRALWLTGGFQLAAPPPHGGDAEKAAALLRRGLEAARRETVAGAGAPAYVPTWGGAENLMNLAYLYSHSALKDRRVAQAYAEGALVAAPEWRYVRDVLMPQILALEEARR